MARICVFLVGFWALGALPAQGASARGDLTLDGAYSPVRTEPKGHPAASGSAAAAFRAWVDGPAAEDSAGAWARGEIGFFRQVPERRAIDARYEWAVQGLLSGKTLLDDPNSSRKESRDGTGETRRLRKNAASLSRNTGWDERPRLSIPHSPMLAACFPAITEAREAEKEPSAVNSRSGESSSGSRGRIPVPAAVFLLGSALTGLIVMGRRFHL